MAQAAANGSNTASNGTNARGVFATTKNKGKQRIRDEEEDTIPDSAVESKQTMKLIDKINQIHDFAEREGFDLGVPELVVVGKQSAGKSSLVEGLLGFMFNFTQMNIATRCPLYLRLIRDPSALTPQWTLLSGPENGPSSSNSKAKSKILTTEEVAKMIMDRNISLQNTVSNLPIRLQVRYHKCVTLSFVDLPGLRFYAKGPEEDALRKQIADLVKQTLLTKMRTGDLSIVLVEVAGDDIPNSAALGFLKDEISDDAMERTILVLNKFDALLEANKEKQSVVQVYMSQLAETIPEHMPVFFTSFPDDQAKNALRLQQQQLHGQPPESFLDDYQKERDKRAVADRGVVKQIMNENYAGLKQVGYDNFANHIYREMVNKYLKALPEIKQKLKAKKEDTEKKLNALGPIPEEAEILQIKVHLGVVCAEFSKQIISLLEGTGVAQAQKYAQTLQQEYEDYTKTTGDVARFSYVRRFGENPECAAIFDKLVKAGTPFWGGSQLRRILLEYKVAIWTAEFPKVKNLETIVQNLWFSLNPYNNTEAAWNEVIAKVMGLFSFEVFQRDVQLLCNRMAWLAKRMYEPAIEMCTQHGWFLKENPVVNSALRTQYMDYVDKWKTVTLSHMTNYVHSCTKTFHHASPELDVDDDEYFNGDVDSANDKEVAERVYRIMTPKANKTEADLKMEKLLLFTHKDHPEDPETMLKLRRTCALHFHEIRKKIGNNIEQIFQAFFKLPLFDELGIHLAKWAGSDDNFNSLIDERSKLVGLMKELDTQLQLVNQLQSGLF